MGACPFVVWFHIYHLYNTNIDCETGTWGVLERIRNAACKWYSTSPSLGSIHCIPEMTWLISEKAEMSIRLELLSDAEYARDLPLDWDRASIAQAQGPDWDPVIKPFAPRVHSSFRSIDDYAFRMAASPALRSGLGIHSRVTQGLSLCREFLLLSYPVNGKRFKRPMQRLLARSMYCTVHK